MSDSLKARLLHVFAYPVKLSNERKGPNLKIAKRTYLDLAKETLFESFPPDAYSPSRKELTLDSPYPETPHAGKFLHTRASFFTSFFGLPNRFDETGKITLKQMAKNFIGGWDWKNETSPSKKILQVLGLLFGIKSILIPSINLLAILFKTIFNIIGIFTEFLPSFLGKASALAMSRLIAPLETKKKLGEKALLIMGIIFLAVPHAVFRIVSLVGRAFSSPRKSAEMAWATGAYLAGKKNQKLGYLLGSVFAILSLATTMATWAVLLPLTLHLIPAAVSNFLAPVLHLLKSIGHFLSPIFAPILSQIASTFSLSISAATASIGLGLAALGSSSFIGLSTLYREASDFWIWAWRQDGFLRKIFEPLDSILDKLVLKWNFNLSKSTPASPSSPPAEKRNEHSDAEGQTPPRHIAENPISRKPHGLEPSWQKISSPTNLSNARNNVYSERNSSSDEESPKQDETTNSSAKRVLF